MPAIDLNRWSRISPVLGELLEADDAHRAEQLTQIAASDPDLAADLTRLLAHRAEVETAQFLEGSALAAMDQRMLEGRAVGSYTLDCLLGCGGMGSVWLAHRSDGRYEGRAAVKFLNLAWLGHGGEERFRREGVALARLSHPNIAQLIDAGTDRGQPYLVLEYVEGKPIDEWCDALTLTLDERIGLFRDVLAAVVHAHERLILHRDLKPSNILVTLQGRAMLLDFGVAKLLDDPRGAAFASGNAQKTARVFTPDYAAPEQVCGGEVTTATDVYTLGVLLHTLLVGEHPTARDGNQLERLQAVVEREPSRMSEAVLRGPARIAELRRSTPARLAHQLRGDLDRIVARALKKEPAERYATAAAFADDLRRYLEHEPVEARGDSPAYRIGKFIRRNRSIVAGVAAAVLLLVGGIVSTTWQVIEVKRQRDEARFQARRAEAERRFTTLMMAEIGPGGRPATLEEVLDRGVELLDKQYGDEPAFVVSMLIGLSGRYMDLGNTRKEHAVLVKAESIARSLGPELLADVQCSTVETEIALGDMRAAAARLAEGRALIAGLAKPDFEVSAGCLYAQSRLSGAQGQIEDGIRFAEQAVAVLERENATRGIQYTGFLSQIESLHAAAGNIGKALEINRRGQAAHEKAGRAGTLGMLVELHNEASHLASAGQVRDALARQRNVVARSGPEPAMSRLYGELLLRTEQPVEALQWLDASLRGLREQGAVPMQTFVEALRSSALLALGRTAEALAEFPDLSALEAASDSASRRALLRVRVLRADMLLARNEVAAARSEVDRALANARATNHLGRAQPALFLSAARIAMAERRTADALRYAIEALAIAERRALRADRSADVGESLLVFATSQHAAGDRLAAKDAARRAHQSLRHGLGPEHSLTRAAAAMMR